MKNISIHLIVVMFVFTTKAQSQSRNSFLAFNFGLSAPVGMFASTLDSDDSPGYAMTGFTGDLTYSAAFEKKPLFGYSISLIAQSYALDDYQYERDLSYSFPGASVTAFTGYWNCFGFLSGPNLNIKISDKSSIMTSIQGGYFFVSSPEFSVYLSDQSGYQTIVQESNTASAPALSIGLGLTSKLTERLMIFGKGEFQNCSPSFEDVKVEELKTGYFEKFDFTQPMSVFNFKTGIGYIF